MTQTFLSLDQRVRRLLKRLAELELWEKRSVVPLDAWTFNGAPITGVVEPGTYGLVCTIHPAMTGEVTVVA